MKESLEIEFVDGSKIKHVVIRDMDYDKDFLTVCYQPLGSKMLCVERYNMTGIKSFRQYFTKEDE